MNALHELDIQGLEPVSGGRDEVEAGVDAGVREGDAVDAGLGVQEVLVLALHVVDDGVPAVRVVDGVAEAGRVHDRQGQVHAALLQENLVGINLEKGNSFKVISFVSKDWGTSK